MKLRLEHIGIAVEDLAAARRAWAAVLGLSASEVEDVPSEGVRVSFFDLGGARIELLEGTGPESPVRKFLDRGRTGVHHLSIAVEEGGIDRLFADLAAKGIPVLGDAPRPGSAGTRVFFVHPRATGGVLVEFSAREGGGRP